MTSIAQTDLSDDTQSALLLSAPLRSRSKDGPAALTPLEYNELAAALHAESMRPGDLLRTTAASTLPKLAARCSDKTRGRVTPERLLCLLERSGQLALALSRWTSAGIWIVSRSDDRYPTRYKRKLGRSAPLIVYGLGPAALLECGGLAVVGSRQPDASSQEYTERLGRWAGSTNVQIVSGAARGVDETAMVSSVNAGGTALGVVADSLLKLSMRREFREGILAERLTLVSSFDPDAGFTVGNAMGRNRWIYALADRALVVACSEGRGGTWAGAVEALKRHELVYVRTGNPERPGNDALVGYGAVPAPTDFPELFLSAGVGEPVDVEPADVELPAASAEDDDIFAFVAPKLIQRLRKPMKVKEFAASIGLVQSQADAWLKRLLAAGHVTKTKSMYRAAEGSSDHPTLF
jgi:predicted Rossmann fold nucleotide-binding protein DprA/Smf involved in DNA uptake